MASVKKHLEQKEKNEEFAAYLENSKYVDWQIVGIFYAGLHLVKAYLHNQYNISDKDLRTHNDILKNVDQYCTEAIAKSYRFLYRESRTARYECINITSIQLQMTKQMYKSLHKECIIKN